MRHLFAPIWGCLAVAAGLSSAAPARAEYARPPEPSPYQPDEPLPYYREDPPEPRNDDPEPPWAAPRSTVRFHVGPALLMQPSSPGLFVALDIGQRAVGGRISGAWLRADSAEGLSAYSA